MHAYAETFGLTWHPFSFVNYRIVHEGKLKKISDVISATDKLKLAKAYIKYKNFPTTYLDSNTLAEFDDEENAYEAATRELGVSFANNVLDTYVGVYQFHRATEISKAALYSQLNSIKTFTDDWYLQRTMGGKIALPEAFASRLPVHVDTYVEKVASNENGVALTVQGETVQYDAAVVATTATNAKAIYANPTAGQYAVMDQAKYAASIVVAFRLPADTFGNPSGDGDTVSAVWIPYSESTLLSSYSNECEKGEELIRDGKSLLLAFFREDGAHEYIPKTDEEIYAAARAEVTRLCPYINDESILESHDLYRWDEAMPKFYAGSLKKVQHFLETDQGKNNVWFAGDYLNAPWTEGALRMGQRVAMQLDESMN